MGSRVFADANLLLDFTLKRNNYVHAKKLLHLAVSGSIHLFTTPAILHVCSYFTNQQFSSANTKQILLTILNDVEIIDCDHSTALIAVNSNIEDVEDALQYYTALRHGIDFFISSDKKLRKVSLPQLPVYSAMEFLAEVRPR